MRCPLCQTPETRVIDSRLVEENNQVRRRRECIACNERFTTYEVPELGMPLIIKRDQRRSPFDEHKLRSGLIKALEKRPVSTDQMESLINRIKNQLRATGEREVSSATLGELVMNELSQLDQVAYVRFASVYRSFEDVKAFREALNELEEQK